jgi:hypothetical protein
MELIQNAWDQNVSCVDVSLQAVQGRPLAKLVVEDDDPQGFADLLHAYTLFAPSEKKGNPEKRGRFNLGEKLVLAVCEEAEVSSTTGTVVFDRFGRKTHPRRKRERGSRFSGLVRMTRADLAEVFAAVSTLIPPEGIKTIFNGVELARREPISRFEAALPTEVADDRGIMRRAERTTTVSVYDVLPGEVAHIYERGIPVVEMSDRWHVDIGQKIPLNMNRDNVTPSYLRLLRTLVLNEMSERLSEADASSTWVGEALADPRVSDGAVDRVLTLRYGDKRVSFDPSDTEANKLAVSEGYRVIHGGSFNKEAWENIRRAGAAQPAGQVTPSPRPSYGPDGKPEAVVPPEEYTEGIRAVVEYARELAPLLMQVPIGVRVVDEPGQKFGAWYSRELSLLTLNVGRLGRAWFSAGVSDEVNRLLIHEFGHNYEGDHLSKEYHDALCRLGAGLTRLALERPQFFRRFALQDVTVPAV